MVSTFQKKYITFLLHLQQKTAIFVPKKLLSIRIIRQFVDKIKNSLKKQAEDYKIPQKKSPRLTTRGNSAATAAGVN